MRGLLKVGNAFLLGGALGTERRLQQSFALRRSRISGFRAEIEAGCGQFSKSDVRIVSNTV
jgi:hypothetical protein